jgi:hypothetical protein
MSRNASIPEQIKPGYKTTEVWGTISFHLANIALFVLGTIDATWAVTASGIARGIAMRHD